MASYPPYRVFKSRPLPSFVDQIRTQIREHGSPEYISELRHEAIDKNEYFEILAEIDIDGPKRQAEGLAPCPMCQPNKFLSGRLCWFPALECCAIIGHCCANKEQSAAAERRYADAARLEWQEDYFLEALPLVPHKLTILQLMQPLAAEADRIHRKLRKDAGRLMAMLREETRAGGQLTVHFEIEQQARQGEGNFSASRVFDTVSYGIMDGSVAIRSNYRPLAELSLMTTNLQVWNVGNTEGDVVDAIASMNGWQRERGYSVLTSMDHKDFPNFADKIADFAEFFSSQNLARLHQWGGDKRNPTPMGATEYALPGVGRQIQLSGAGCLTRLMVPDSLYAPIPAWEKVAKH